MPKLKDTLAKAVNGTTADNDKKDPNAARNTVIIIIITVAVVLALLIFSVYKVFSNYPFTLPSYIAFYIVILTLFLFFFPLARTYLEYRALQLLQKTGQLEQYVTQFLTPTVQDRQSPSEAKCDWL